MIDKSDILKVLAINVTDMDFSQRLCEILIVNGIKTVENIVSYTEEELFDLLGNEAYIDEIKYKIKVIGCSLRNNKMKKNANVSEKMTIREQIELLRELKILLDDGVLTQEEFEKKKQEILNS